MKSTSVLFKSLLCIATALTMSVSAIAQSLNALPVCSGRGAGLVYFADANTNDIYKIDPLSPGTVTPTGIQLPTGAKSLAVSRNLNGGATTPTYYTTIYNGTDYRVFYYDNVATAWQPTTHRLNAQNIAGGGGYIFGLDTNFHFIFRYDGSSNAVVILNNVGNTGSSDLAADCSGNFYVIDQAGGSLRKYSAAGTLLSNITINGTPMSGAGGLAVNGNNVFYDGSDGKLYSGVISGGSITFSASSASPFTAHPVLDFGSCGVAGLNNATYGIDTVKSCNGASNFTLYATGAGPYNWTVLSGPATFTTSGNSATFNAPSTSVVTVRDADCGGSNTLIDTVVFFIANATVTVTPNHVLGGCQGDYVDTLYAHITNTTPGVAYAYNWYPISNILSGNTDTIAYVIPRGPNGSVQTFRFEATTISGCVFKDSVKITLVDSTPKAEFTYQLKQGCNGDTVRFFNQSSPSRLIDSFAWKFGDGTFTDQASPVHIYPYQAYFQVVLTAKNRKCTDSIQHNIFISHPASASFTVNDDSVCANTIVKFTNTSNASNPTFLYIFGDGATSTLASPTHNYTRAGTYHAKLAIRNFLGCRDTFEHIIQVDSTPFARYVTPDTLLCEGQAIHLQAQFLTIGNTGISFDLGDGTTFTNRDQVTYSFAAAGTYSLLLTAHYRICPDAVYPTTVVVHPFPGVNLGPDTVLCPNGAPVVLTDRVNSGNPAATYLWNTGETTAAIFARENGTYWLRVAVNGCSGTDSIQVRKDCYIDIPNVFSPNGDGTNDYFLPRQLMSRSLNAFHLTVYNRWGQMVYETRSIDGRGWDGRLNDKDQPSGVYIYMIDVTFDNNVKEHYTGNVTLIR